MVTLTDLRSRTSKDLAKLAKTKGVTGWNTMKKEQLVQAILKNAKKRQQSPTSRAASTSRISSNARSATKSESSTGANHKASNGKQKSVPVNRVRTHARRKPAAEKHPAKSLDVERSAVANRLERESSQRESLKDLARTAAINKESKNVDKDRMVLIVRDSYWLQVYWEVTQTTVNRAKSSLEKHWRGAKPVLRLYEIVEEHDALTEHLVREIEIHSGVDSWYIDTPNPPKTYRTAIGYVTAQGRFFSIAKSNRVSTPSPNACSHSSHWADIASDCENIFAMSGGYNPNEETAELRDIFEEKLKRPMLAMGPNHAALLDQNIEFPFEVDAQMVIYGVAVPGSSVTLAGEPLKVDNNGTFSIRMELPDKRQVLPVVASSRDGSQQRTTVLAIERNTKVMEVVSVENDEL